MRGKLIVTGTKIELKYTNAKQKEVTQIVSRRSLPATVALADAALQGLDVDFDQVGGASKKIRPVDQSFEGAAPAKPLGRPGQGRAPQGRPQERRDACRPPCANCRASFTTRTISCRPCRAWAASSAITLLSATNAIISIASPARSASNSRPSRHCCCPMRSPRLRTRTTPRSRCAAASTVGLPSPSPASRACCVRRLKRSPIRASRFFRSTKNREPATRPDWRIAAKPKWTSNPRIAASGPDEIELHILSQRWLDRRPSCRATTSAAGSAIAA